MSGIWDHLRPWIAAIIVIAAGAGCAGRQLAASLGGVRQQAQQARDNGALRCAPRELAMADTHVEFAARELDEGDYFRAREHLHIAEDNAREALRLSPRARCLEQPAAADRDGDGIPDAVDRCPAEPEDKDGFEDGDGCPDLDNDKDGVADAQDKCPLEAEDKDGFEDGDGCPDPDNDKDGVADAQDKCPLEAEDKDGFEDDDGCPDPDNDKDTVADGDDRCPLQAGPVDNGGCPKKYQHIVVTSEKIELKQKVFFETNKAAIMSRSYGLLAEIANVLQTRPTMRLRIEGHTDARGTPRRNMTLSEARANEVRTHLVGLGISGDRLEARGFGAEQPIETNKTGAGRERNRRVEFVITEQ
jgi:outer membrane protein OmpA-like peptidoglycan-associated protein